MFVRVKNIKGRKYAYLVENEWTPWGSRQRVTKYLGKLISVERAKEDVLELPNGFKEAIMVAITQEVENHHAAEQKINVDHERRLLVQPYAFPTNFLCTRRKSERECKQTRKLGC